MSVASVYDFETVFASAVAAVLTDGGFKAITQVEAQETQKPRPRVEVIFQCAGQLATGPRQIMPDGSLRFGGYTGELLLHVITDADEDGKNTHGKYRAALRNYCGDLMRLLNGTALTQHRINLIVEGSTTHGFHPEHGYEGSTISFSVSFSIQADAYVTLNGTN